jgi:hypothetical protein
MVVMMQTGNMDGKQTDTEGGMYGYGRWPSAGTKTPAGGEGQLSCQSTWHKTRNGVQTIDRRLVKLS